MNALFVKCQLCSIDVALALSYFDLGSIMFPSTRDKLEASGTSDLKRFDLLDGESGCGPASMSRALAFRFEVFGEGNRDLGTALDALLRVDIANIWPFFTRVRTGNKPDNR